jgi:hypothetical protein
MNHGQWSQISPTHLNWDEPQYQPPIGANIFTITPSLYYFVWLLWVAIQSYVLLSTKLYYILPNAY